MSAPTRNPVPVLRIVSSLANALGRSTSSKFFLASSFLAGSALAAWLAELVRGGRRDHLGMGNENKIADFEHRLSIPKEHQRLPLFVFILAVKSFSLNIKENFGLPLVLAKCLTIAAL